MAKLYDFGADTGNIGVNERKAVAWPIAVWACYIPDSEFGKLNILEHLILQLVHHGMKDPKEVLCGQVGLNRELVGAAVETCRNKGYFDDRHSELVLSQNGEAVLGKMDNPYEADLQASKKNKKIYMLQDLVTKNVIPVFDVDKLPEFYLEDDNAIEIRYENFSGKKPGSVSIKMALKYWGRLCSSQRLGLVLAEDTMDMPKNIPFEDEVNWELVREDGSVEEEAGTLAEREKIERREEEKQKISNLTILDDSPEIYFARGFIALNRVMPDEAVIISPFGDRTDRWFRAIINRLRAGNPEFEEEIQRFLRGKREELKDSIAFGNELKIALLDRFPFISNAADFADLKRAITDFVKTTDMIVNGDDQTHHYVESRATALQIALRHLMEKNEFLLQRDMGYGEYENAIKGLVNSFRFPVDVERSYLPPDKSIYYNMIKCSRDSGHITGCSALFLVDAWKNRNGSSMELLKAMPEFPQKIYEITRPRNTSTHGNKATKGRDGYAKMYISPEDAVRGYEDFEQLITALYVRFMEET